MSNPYKIFSASNLCMQNSMTVLKSIQLKHNSKRQQETSTEADNAVGLDYRQLMTLARSAGQPVRAPAPFQNFTGLEKRVLAHLALERKEGAVRAFKQQDAFAGAGRSPTGRLLTNSIADAVLK